MKTMTKLVLLTLSLYACADGPSDQREAPPGLAAAIAKDGLTCAHAAALTALPSEGMLEVRALLIQSVGMEGLAKLIEQRERCQSPPPAESIVVEEGPPATIGTYCSAEAIEKESSSSGVQARAVYSDSASLDWMCNSGKPATVWDPADFIVEYEQPGVCGSKDRLRVSPDGFLGVWARCYLDDKMNMARLYTDGTVRMCVGYWSVFFCGAVMPLPKDTRLYLK